MLQSEAGYIDARPHRQDPTKPLAPHGRTIHSGQKHTLPHCNSNGRFSSISGHTKAALIAPSKRDPPAFCRVGIVPGFGSNRSHMAANRLALAFKAALPRGCPDAFPASWRPAARPWCAPRTSPARAEAARMWIVNLLACVRRPQENQPFNRRSEPVPGPSPRSWSQVAPEAGALLLPDLQTGWSAVPSGPQEIPTHRDAFAGIPC
jgi:hypothetical protein